MIKIKKDNLNYLFYKFFKLFRKQKIQKQKNFILRLFKKIEGNPQKKFFKKRRFIFSMDIYIFHF
jgi:hypothetical protein